MVRLAAIKKAFGGTRTSLALVALAAVFAGLLSSCAVIGPHRFVDKEADLTIVHLTDLHLSTKAGGNVATPWTHKIIIGGYKLHRKCLGRTASLLEQAVQAINTRIRPDVVVITGDIVDRGPDEAAFRKAQELIRQIKCPVIVVEGDHDIAGKQHPFADYFGERDGARTVKGHDFFFIGFAPDRETLAKLESRLAGSGSGDLRILCLHRMLRASYLMKKLSKKYCSTILSPSKDAILAMLKGSDGKFLVLCGHSHTNYRGKDGNVLHLCTSSLAEYPHELRIVKITDGKVATKVLRLSKIRCGE